MHKSELEGMTLAELTALAGKLGAELSSDQTTLIYNILDAQSLQATAEPTPKKRGRKRSRVPMYTSFMTRRTVPSRYPVLAPGLTSSPISWYSEAGTGRSGSC